MAAPRTQSATGMLLAEYIRKWTAHNRHARSMRTQEQYTQIIWRFADSVPKHIENITVEHIEAYLERVLRKCKRRTGNCHLAAIKSFYRWCAERYDIPNIAARIKMMSEDPPKQRVLTPEEYEAVLAVCKDGERDIVEFLGNTALRISEFRSLTWSNVDPHNPPRYISFLGKGNKKRFVPLNLNCQRIIAKYKRRADGSPIDFLKNRSSRNAILYLCHRLAGRAGISKFGPHSLRHFAATELVVRHHVDLYRVSKLLGHASTRVTEAVYVHWQLHDVLGLTDVLDEK